MNYQAVTPKEAWMEVRIKELEARVRELEFAQHLRPAEPDGIVGMGLPHPPMLTVQATATMRAYENSHRVPTIIGRTLGNGPGLDMDLTMYCASHPSGHDGAAHLALLHKQCLLELSKWYKR